jgi:hypothetical protein
MRAGITRITRRRFFVQVGEMALGFSAVSRPLLAGGAQPASIPAAPTPVGLASGGRAPFQIMSLRDLAVPSSLQPLRAPDARDRPLSGSYGQPHIMRKSLIAFAHDGTLLYDGDATPPWSPPDLGKLEAHIYGRALHNVSGPDFNGILFINGEGDHWNEVGGLGDNAWRAVDTPEDVDRAVPICISWVDALRQACPKALLGWFAKPAGVQFNWSLAYMLEIAPRQAPLLQALDILSPSLYVWYQAYPDGFDRAVADFRDKLSWIRETFPDKLLCPTVWEEFMLVRSWHDRNPGQACPAQSGGHRYWATIPTYDGKSGQATCAGPSFSRAQWDHMLDMIVEVGCDGLFYWSSNDSWGKYFTDPDEPGIRGLLDFAERLNGATPRGDHTATFLMERGPFAG